ncbi:MAG TPA: SpoIIE family protein phosphatase [Bryobacteraceae bacterium]|nr:SpoIIE family protein phosphatase [Bryobacteraceae bacterium]
MKLSLTSRWKQFGKLEKTFSVLVVLYFILLLLAPGNGFTTFLQFLTVVLALWILLRLARAGLRQAIWRLRNRLIVTYVLIAVVPILLIVALVGIGGYMLAAQIAVYVARNELDRTVAAMHSATDVLKRADPKSRPAVLASTGEVYSETYPRISLLIASGEGNVQRWGEDPAVEPPPKAPEAVNGFVQRGGRYFAWSFANQDGVKYLAITPLNRHFLSWMVPGLGDVYFLQPSSLSDRDQTVRYDNPFGGGGKQTRAPVNLGQDKFDVAPAGRESAASVLAPPVNRFDISVYWGSFTQAADWDDASKTRRAFLALHTRPSALLGVLFSERADDLQGLLPIIFYAVAIAFLIVELVSLVVGVSLTRTITGAVHNLYQGTARVMHSDFSHKIPVSGRDQIADLSRSFNTMTENLERLLAVAKEKERLETEIEIARQVQEQLYPKAAPALKTLRVTGMCEPARMVSGDYYDYQALSDHQLAIAIGDVAGKGISAALLMATIQAALRMELRAALDSPAAHASTNGFHLSAAQMVSDLNQQLYATTSPEKYATFCFALYDEETGAVTYTNAGHPPPILIRGGSATRLDVNGTVVGAFPFSKYGESKVQLERGDLLVWYTDGITEPEDAYGEMFGEERLIELISKNAERPDAQIIQTVMESVRQWTASPELSDDMTVVLARKS